MSISDEYDLNPEQKQAVEYNEGPMLIIAGAGTGKTHVVVEKIKYLIKKNLARPEDILALTFTEKAASEMEERVDKIMPYGYFQMWISTFHAFAEQILKENITHIGLSPTSRLITEAESIIFLKKNLFLFNLKYFRPLGNPNKFLEALLQHFSRLKDENISPDEYLIWVKKCQKDKQLNQEEKDKYQELSFAYNKYQELKVKEGVIDFSDMVYYLIKLFEKRPNILKKYQQQFKFVLVDEFQDTNFAQYILIKMLCPVINNPKLTVVGDDSQAIYKFRGASVSNILTFMQNYPQALQVTLRKNYRSNQTILDKAYQLIKFNDPDTLEAKLGISKNLIANKKDDKKAVSFKINKQVEDEADYVATQIIKLHKKYKYSDISILVRANSHSEPFIRAFLRNGIPYQFLGPGMLFKQAEVKDLIAYLKILSDLEDSVSMYRVLVMDIFSIQAKDLNLLLGFTKKINTYLFNAIEIYLSFFEQDIFKPEYEIYKKYLPLLSEPSRTQLLFIFKMINRHLSLVKKETGGQLLYYFLEDTKYLNKIIAFKTNKEEKIAQNIMKFFNKLKTFETEHEDSSVYDVVSYIDMSMELGESPMVAQTDISNYDAVNIVTIHSAKGLEFPIVFLVNLSRGRFPTYEKKEIIPIPDELIKEILPEGDFHLEEERRLFYVGITRAMDKIYLTTSQFYGEGKRERKLSPFVVESLGEEFIKNQLNITSFEKKQLSIFDFKKQEEKIEKINIIINNFSYSQLESYKLCPLRYKYQYILKIPTTTSASASFGTTIHKTLQKFYQDYLNDNNLKLNDLIKTYKSAWIPIGYSTKDHQEKMKQTGEIILINYFKQFHRPNIKIIALEKFFKFKLTNDIFITGKIDRVDLKNNNEIDIIDYKTGKKPDEKELKKSLQLSIYARAAQDRGIYNKPLDLINLTFYYLQNMETISMKRTIEDMENVSQEITTLVEEIRKNQFTPKVGPWCDFCPFRMICEAW